jgi:hypothetical protein
MSYAFASLLRNVAAGARTALFLPVSRLAFRVDLLQLFLLFVLSAAMDIARDIVHTGPERVFSLQGAGTEFFGAGMLMSVAIVLALAYRQRALVLALPVLVLASLPVLMVALELPLLLRAHDVPVWVRAVVADAVLVWIVVVFVRCVALAMEPATTRRIPRALLGGLLLAAPIWVGNSFGPNNPWFVEPGDSEEASGLNAGSEPVLATQAFLLDQLLEKLEDERPGVTDLYFVGFAPYGRQDVFRKDVEAAQKVMDERWGTVRRSIVLVNNPHTLLTAPFASITNLRETLNEIGGAIDAENDVVMVYLVSHGSRDHHLAAAQPPLTLVELTPGGMRQMLDDAGIAWRIVVVSACYSGGYIEPLKDPQTLVITASHADKVSFGCGDRSDATYFGEAFFQHGLATADTFEAAFAAAEKRVRERETAEGHAPASEPQLWVGEAMAEKLKSLRSRSRTGGVSAGLFRALPAATRQRAPI